MKSFAPKISYRNLNKTSNDPITRDYQNQFQYPTSSQEDIKFEKSSNRQYTLGPKQNNQYLNTEKSQLLKQREQNYKNDAKNRKKSQLSFDYGSHQYIQTENHSPSPKFNTRYSVSEDSNRDCQQEAIVEKISKLKPFMEKMINQCEDENLQVVQGLKSLKQAHQQILRQLQQESYKQNNKKKHRYKEQDNNGKIKISIAEKMKQLKAILNKIIKDSKNGKEQIKKNIQNIKSIYDEFQQDEYEMNLHRKKQSFQSDSIPLPSKKFTTDMSTVYRDNVINEQDDQNYVDNLQLLDTKDQILGLDNLQSRIVRQIIDLRKEKTKLIDQLRKEKQKNKVIIEQFKKIEKSYIKLKNQNKEDSQFQSESIINKLKKGSYDYTNNVQRNPSETQKLKSRIKQLQTIISKLKENQINKSNQIKSLKNELERRSSEFQQNKFNNRNLDEQNQILKNQLAKMQKYIKELEGRNMNRKPQQNSQLRQELKKLKKENQQLRIQTIQILKNKGINYNRIKTEEEQYLREKHYPRKVNNINKTNDTHHENLYIPLDRLDKKNTNNDSSNRLKEYRQLLSGLQNISPRND